MASYRRKIPRIEWGANRKLFKYRAGDDLTALGGTHTRADASTCASYVDENGVLQYAAANVLRDGHYIGGVRHTLLEQSATNLCLRSEDFGSAPWSSSGTVTRTAAAHTASGTTLDLLGDNDATVAAVFVQTITLPSGTVVFSVDVKAGTAAITVVKLRAVGVADRGRLLITWAGGVPSVVANVGTYLGAEARADGVYRLYCSAPGVVGTDPNQIQVYPAGEVTSAATGTVYAGAVQVVASASPSSYIPTAGATVTRAADVLYFPYAALPQEATIYVRGVNTGALISTGATRRLVHIGAQNTSLNPQFSIYGSNADSATAFAYNDGTTNAVDFVGGATPVPLGAVAELRGVLSDTWTAFVARAIDGAAEVEGSPSASSGAASAWADDNVWLAGTGGHSAGFAFEAVVIAASTQTMDRMRAFAAEDAEIFESVITFAYPLDEAISHSPPAEGSQMVFHPSGVADAWDTGSAHRLAGVVRWIPGEDTVAPAATGWDGDEGWNAFLQWARRGNQFWFCPDADDLSTGWTVSLEAPFDDPPDIEPDMSRAVRVQLRGLTAFTGF